MVTILKTDIPLVIQSTHSPNGSLLLISRRRSLTFTHPRSTTTDTLTFGSFIHHHNRAAHSQWWWWWWCMVEDSNRWRSSVFSNVGCRLHYYNNIIISWTHPPSALRLVSLPSTTTTSAVPMFSTNHIIHHRWQRQQNWPYIYTNRNSPRIKLYSSLIS